MARLPSPNSRLAAVLESPGECRSPRAVLGKQSRSGHGIVTKNRDFVVAVDIAVEGSPCSCRVEESRSLGRFGCGARRSLFRRQEWPRGNDGSTWSGTNWPKKVRPRQVPPAPGLLPDATVGQPGPPGQVQAGAWPTAFSTVFSTLNTIDTSSSKPTTCVGCPASKPPARPVYLKS